MSLQTNYNPFRTDRPAPEKTQACKLIYERKTRTDPHWGDHLSLTRAICQLSPFGQLLVPTCSYRDAFLCVESSEDVGKRLPDTDELQKRETGRLSVPVKSTLEFKQKCDERSGNCLSRGRQNRDKLAAVLGNISNNPVIRVTPPQVLEPTAEWQVKVSISWAIVTFTAARDAIRALGAGRGSGAPEAPSHRANKLCSLTCEPAFGQFESKESQVLCVVCNLIFIDLTSSLDNINLTDLSDCRCCCAFACVCGPNEPNSKTRSILCATMSSRAGNVLITFVGVHWNVCVGSSAMSSGGPLPPVPDLIPISALRRASTSSASSSTKRRPKRCRSSGASSSSCSSRSCTAKEVMGEQRSRRTANKPADLIDSAGSRGSSAAPQPPQSRKIRSERHRKSDRRREHRKPARTQSGSSKHNNINNNNSHSSSSRRSAYSSTSDKVSSPERPANPRVNPIFVFIRQVDTRIVDVKCEDYDKRNRIVLTKTAQGWRAIPRTETLVPTLKDPADGNNKPQTHHNHHHHHHHKSKKSKRTKCRKRSTAVQVSEVDVQTSEPEEEVKDRESIVKEDPNWMAPVNIESLLPSHKILVKKPVLDLSPDLEISNINSAVSDNTQTQSKCSADQINDVSPLDNLLAVAELEFNQQIQSDEWNRNVQNDILDNQQDDNEDYALKTFEESMDDTSKQYMEQLNNLIEACTSKVEKSEENDFLGNVVKKSEECDYNDDEENNMAMDDILTRLEQSLRSPECTEISKMASLADAAANAKPVPTGQMHCIESDINENNYKSVPELESFFEDELKPEILELKENNGDNEKQESETEEQSMPEEELPTDLTVKTVTKPQISVRFDEPTDLSVPKKLMSPPPLLTIPRSPSQNSETIQSPQPSGIPAVPQSPDLVSQSCSASNKKAMFLESLLTTNSINIPLNSEVTIIRQKEPLDLGKSRKSASPTVTCSEEANNTTIEAECMEPPAKKFKPEDITLKNLLDAESASAEIANNRDGKHPVIPDTPRLLELLQNDSEPDPITQLKLVLSDSTIHVPNPILIPKERLDAIILHPGKEIPKLIKQRPELRLPDVLTHEHLSHNPDILVIQLDQLEAIVAKQYYSEKIRSRKKSVEKHSVVEKEKVQKTVEASRPSPPLKKTKPHENASKSSESESKASSLNLNELANDIDAATTAAFNQIMWLPYLNQLEAMSYGNSQQDFMKMFNGSMPFYPGQMHEMPNMQNMVNMANMSNMANMNMANMANMFMNNNNRFPSPLNFPMQPPVNFNNPLEMSMWQEAMMQANMLRPKMPFEGLNQKPNLREYMEKMNHGTKKHSQSNRFHPSASSKPSGFFPGNSNGHPGFQNQFMSLPSQTSRHNLQVPHFNQMVAQQQKALVSQQQKHDYKKSSTNFNTYYSHLAQEKQKYQQQQQQQQQQGGQNNQRGKVSCKPFANTGSKPEASRQAGQPIDLSGSTVTGSSKLKVKQHLVDTANAPRLLKHHDDVPEVGSTTASVEDMQEAHKHLWHPLFGK
ncbi:unnamed protein product [Brassicogethes aeneus]|uniref:Uncharacterized protein n=1 Tax=Brassicogethes aeneus TaxID=1431903 RepID=A0A9P0AVB7_BRAAE|nr:unnamed protein product [Brassicogethes aeneus]